jgi:hypothetical protein
MARKRQIGVALDEELRLRLEASAKAGGRNISDEIRNRLEQTTDQDAYETDGEKIIQLLVRNKEVKLLFDKPTQELANDVMLLARDVGFSKEANWHQHPAVHAALVEAINAWLNAIKPSDENKEVSQQMKQRGYDPQGMGRTVAHIRLRNKHREQEYERDLPLYEELFDESRELGREGMAELFADLAELRRQRGGKLNDKLKDKPKDKAKDKPKDKPKS